MSTTPTATLSPLESSGSGAGQIHHIRLNHPKNYLAVPLAMTAVGPTDELIRTYAVDLPDEAKCEATEFGLLSSDGNLTELGEATVVTADCAHGGVIQALEAFQALHGSPRRFTDALPDWETIARRTAFQYPATRHLVEFLRRHGPLPLNELAYLLWKRKPRLATSVFLRPTAGDPDSASAASPPPWDVLDSPTTYRSEVAFQYKATLCHSGVLKSRGDYTTRLDPSTDLWELDE